MRRKDRPRTLWIDAICINEADVDERGHQVGIMYEIYTHNRHNCIYLGPDDGSMLKVIESIDAILREISNETRNYAEFNEMLIESSGWSKYSDAPFSIDINQSDLWKFFENSWFSRLWVVQEAALSHISTCYCGVFHISLTDVLYVGSWLVYKWNQLLQQITTAQFVGMSNAKAMFHAANRTHGRHFRHRPILWHFLAEFAGLHTFDRRDQVSALVALWQMHTETAVLPATLKPDYALGVSKVFRNACEFAIQETNSLVLLRNVHASQDGKDTALWPSWVPVFDRKLGSEIPWFGLLTRCNAHNESPMRVLGFDDGSNTLNVDGLMVDEVVDLTWIPTKCTASSLTTFVASAESLRPYSTWVGALRGGPEQRASLVLIAGRTYGFDRVTDEEALQGYRNFKTYVKDRSCAPPHVP
jgi:hypothetical protein